MMSLLLHKSKANLKQTMSVNNKNIIGTFLGYNLLIYSKGLSQTLLLLWNNRQWLLVAITCQN